MTRLALVLSTVALFGGAAGAQEKKELPGSTAKAGTAAGDAHKEKILHNITRSAAPDAHHKLLEPLVGKWNTQAKQWLGDPKPETTTGHAEIKSILGGRFVEEHYDSVIFGKPYQGQGVIGFDTRTKKFVSSWVDTWGTWITVEEGDADATGKVLTLTAQDYDSASGKTRPVKFIYTIDGNDHHVMRVYETIEGKETLTMEVDYKKAK
ncbi:MAG: DUF1579 domain-containing protein [Polyangia bacterium]